MNRLATLAICMTLAAAPALSAQAQPAAGPPLPSQQIQRAAKPAVHCTRTDNGARATHPCQGKRAVEATYLGKNVTSQEIDCLLSGMCSAVARTES
jgi:hypothetical protein